MSQKDTRTPVHKEFRFKFNVVLLVTWCLGVLVTFSLSFAYALNLDKAKIYFIKGDYKSAIIEGERIIAGLSDDRGADELYYILGLSYLKDGNYLRASDIFEIILKEFKDSKFKDEANLGLGDTYFLRGDYQKAQGYYKELIKTNPRSKLKPIVYYRLSQIQAKLGNSQLAKEYSDKLNKEFPLNLEAKLNKDLYSLSDIYYTVQVGSFVNPNNARNLCNKLINKGYDAYIQEVAVGGKSTYRVRVGKLTSRFEAVQLENRLTQEGYPTKIYP